MHLSGIKLHPEKYPVNDCYPFNLELFRRMDAIRFSQPVTFFIGENGAGKSTLMKAICLKCGIYIWEDESTTRFRYNRYEDELYKYLDVEWSEKAVPGSFFSSQIFHDFARTLDERARATPAILDYFGGESLITKSHGESFISFFRARYKIKGIYFMDEPETALSPGSQLKLLEIIREMSRAGHAQFIIASHSPILLACPGATIYHLDGSMLKTVAYEETEYYRIYRDFLNNREKYLEGMGE